MYKNSGKIYKKLIKLFNNTNEHNEIHRCDSSWALKFQ